MLLGLPALAFGQQSLDTPQSALFHFGPLALTPKVAIRNLGLDSNVFNASASPEQDFTMTVAPGVDAWLRVGRVLLSSRTTTEWVYYQKTASERSFNAGEVLRVDIDLTHATPRIGGTYVNTRQRPNDEIDQRVQQLNQGGSVGVTIPAGSRFKFDADARRTRYDYLDGAYGDPAVAQALNRDSGEVSLAGRIELTPLTSLAVRAEAIQDRFVYSPERDSDSLRVMPGVIFQPFALVSGSAFVGVRRLTTIDPAVPDYSGMVADVELKYVAGDMFRVVGRVKRDIDYSLDLGEPFYVSTSVGAEVTQLMGLNWDVVGRIRHGSLAYPQVSATQPGRVDYVDEIGAGVGRRVSDHFRLGFDVSYVRRTSVLDERAYDGYRLGGSFTYGY